MNSEFITELATALAKAQSEIKAAAKDTSNPFYKSKYADLHSIWDACREALNKNGLSVTQTIDVAGEAAVLTTRLLHSSGQWILGRCPLINQKGDMQGLGSAISYARRYGLAAICGVVTEDDDANTADRKTTSPVVPRAVAPFTTNAAALTSDYVIPLKKFAGKKLHEVQDFELLNYVDWIKKEGIIKPDFLEFIKHTEAYLAKLYKKDPKKEPDTIQDDIPDWVK